MDAVDQNYQWRDIETPTGDPETWLVGLGIERATKLLGDRGMTLRVARRQGCECILTRDHRPFRWNVDVDAVGNITEVLGRG